MFFVSGVGNILLQLYFWRFRPGAPDLRLGFLHKIKLSTGIVFVSDQELVANTIVQAIVGLSFVLLFAATAVSVGIEKFGSNGREVAP